jgi:hypothetical protein
MSVGREGMCECEHVGRRARQEKKTCHAGRWRGQTRHVGVWEAVAMMRYG